MLVALIGLVLAGSASGFGYWVWSDRLANNDEAPAFSATATADKTIRPPQADDKQGDNGTGGRIADEERPVDTKGAASPQALAPMSVVYGAAPLQAAGLEAGTASPSSLVRTPVTQGPPRPTEATAPAAPITLGRRAPAAEPSVAQGRYLVQLSSQRSERAAQATSQALQTKYANMFGDRQPFIRRSDLGDRGVYYRVQVGPFATIEEANQFCGSLKKAGADCVVQKN
jgi:cell division septation protein DedD